MDAGGQESLARAGTNAGLTDVELSAFLRAASPLLIRKLHDRMRDANGRNWIRGLRDSGGPQQFIDRPMLMDSSAVAIEGNRLLDRLVGGHSVAEQISLRLSQQAELNLKQVKQALRARRAVCWGRV